MKVADVHWQKPSVTRHIQRTVLETQQIKSVFHFVYLCSVMSRFFEKTCKSVVCVSPKGGVILDR
jgi:hypothetical protein